MASRDVRVRVTEGVVRVRVNEPAIRAVVRVTTPEQQLNSQYTYLSKVETGFLEFYATNKHVKERDCEYPVTSDGTRPSEGRMSGSQASLYAKSAGST